MEKTIAHAEQYGPGVDVRRGMWISIRVTTQETEVVRSLRVPVGAVMGLPATERFLDNCQAALLTLFEGSK